MSETKKTATRCRTCANWESCIREAFRWICHEGLHKYGTKDILTAEQVRLVPKMKNCKKYKRQKREGVKKG